MNIDPTKVTEHERTTWNRCAPIYIETVAPMTQQGYQLIAESGFISKGVRLLDIGCGPGNLTAGYAELGARVTGIDVAEEMVELARSAFPEIGFHQSDVSKLPFGNSTFDVVTAGYVMHHLGDPTSALKEFRRVLKDNGAFVFVIPVQDSQPSFGAFFHAVGEHHELEAMPSGPLLFETDIPVLESMVMERGFSSCNIERRTVMCNMKSLDLLIRAGREIANLRDLDPGLQKKIEEATYSNAEPYRHKDGTYRFPDEVLYGVAKV